MIQVHIRSWTFRMYCK